MLNFRTAAASNDIVALENLWTNKASDFDIDATGHESGKTAAHFAAQRGHFKAIYWLFDKGANFYCKDNEKKTPLDYLQQKEFALINSNPTQKGDRQYHLCNAHCKVWFAHDREIFMPYLYQNDFKEYREKNADGYMSLVYSRALLSETAYTELLEFAKKYQIALISFEEELSELTKEFGTEGDQKCYKWASHEIAKYPDQGGGNLVVVADLIRWSTVILRKGHYTDTDVELGRHEWKDSILMEKPFALNLGSVVYTNKVQQWLNIDIIAVSSLFSKPHPEGNFRITISKTACSMIKVVQSYLVRDLQKERMEVRLKDQRDIIRNFSDLSRYLQGFFASEGLNPVITNIFSSMEINKLKFTGLDFFSKEEKSSIIERMSNLIRRKVESEYDTLEMAYQYSKVLKDVKSDNHEKFLMNYMLAMQANSIVNGVKKLSGLDAISGSLWNFIDNDIDEKGWKEYSIYSNKTVQSAFRSTNGPKIDISPEEHDKMIKTEKGADISFTAFGMADVLQRSQTLKAVHIKNI